MSALPNGVSSTAAASPSKMPGNKSDPALKPISAAASSPAAADPASALHSATSTSDVRAALAALHAHEDELTARLDGLRASHADLNRDLLRLDSLRAALGSQVIVTRGISNTMLASAADTAGRLSSSVRALDLEKSRVEETLRVVEQVAELKACVAGVVGSMGAPQDWEAAAGYIARASRIPDEIVRSGFANAVVPTVEIPDAPSETLEEARESLCGLFLREFEKAAKEGDGAKVTRFFKLFPLIGRGDVGLDVYGRYVCQGVAGEARAVLKENSTLAGQTRKDGFFYANALTRLFEHIARIVDAHGGLVERHYGSGKIIKVIERLQMEADVQGGIILDSWSDERAVERKITDVRSYPFSFLVQSFVSQHRGPLGTSRVNSPALGGGADKPRDSEDEGVNMKEVDGLLNEIAAMLGKWALYTRFLASKCKDPDASADAAFGIPSLITKSNLHRKVATKLIAPYEAMMAFYFRRSVEKAFQLDEMPSGLSLTMSKPIDSNPPYIISAVDDVMYIVSAVIRKSLSTCQRDVVASIIPAIGRILSSDFVVMIQKKMRDEYYPKPVVRDGLPPEDKVIGFIVLNNTLDMANEYLSRIISGRLGVSPDQPTLPDISTSPLKEFFPFEQDIALVTSWLNNLNTSFQAKTTELLNDGLTALFNNVIRARLRPVLQETFRDADYSLTEDELAELAAQNFDGDEEQLLEQVPRRFEHGWDALMRPIARLATPSTFATLLDLTARHLARVLEKRVWSYGGRTSAYGAIRMERDFNGVVATVARERYGVRELFARTSQVLMVANMEEDEWEELAGESADDDDDGMVWHITEEERRKARTLVRV